MPTLNAFGLFSSVSLSLLELSIIHLLFFKNNTRFESILFYRVNIELRNELDRIDDSVLELPPVNQDKVYPFNLIAFIKFV